MSYQQAKRIILPLNVISIIASVLLLFGLLPKLTGAVCVLCVLVSWVLLFRFPDCFSLHSAKTLKSRGLEEQYCSLEWPLCITAALSTMRILRTHTPANWGESLLAGVILTVVLLILALRFLSDRDMSVGELITYVLLFGMFHIGCIWQVNLLLDVRAPEYEWVIVQTVDSSRSRKGGTTYYIKVELDGEEQRINVPFVKWAMLEGGDTVKIAIHPGGLGMEYYTLETP